MMPKSDNPYGMVGQATYKKVQNYIFKFSDMIGQGNFSKVYKAYHELNNEMVAIKIIQLNSLKSKKLEELLFSQIDVLKKLNHPNILKCYEVFTSNRNCYIITQLCNGGDLQSQLRKTHHFKQCDAQPIIRDIFSGLLYLAEKNVIHRDLKVANIFVHNGTAKIADFGFAREKFQDINIGSPIYMSPQGLINNSYGPKTDVWAFGILLYQLLHGETPYAFCQTENQLKYHISVPITWSQIKPDLPSDLKEVILRCMEVQQEKRGTAFELKNTTYLRKLLSQTATPNIEPNYKSLSNRREQLIDKRRNMISSGNDKGYSPIHIDQNRNLSSKNTKTISNQHNKKGYSTDKFTINKHQQQNSTSTKKTTHSSSLIVSSISFKESVNVLHYCRLLYKYIISLKQSPYSDPNQVSKVVTWLMKVLKEVNDKIENKEIIYEGDNIWLREKKLKEVSTQYTKKYTLELGNHSSNIYHHQMTLEHMTKYFYSIFQHVDSLIARDNNQHLLLLGHSIVIITDATKLLNRCSYEANYKLYGQYKDIENFVSMNKDAMDIHSYMLFRKKLTYDN